MAHNYTKAAERGVPSLVWRAGQNRRLKMIELAAGCRLAKGRRVLVDGCGIGMYNRALLDYSDGIFGIDIEAGRIIEGAAQVPNLIVGQAEYLPYPNDAFDIVLSHEVIEHVADDGLYAAEMVRVLKPGGRGIIFCPNRLYPFEIHGHYWRGKYHFGNTPLINYLPNIWRDKLAPHVRVYTKKGLQSLFSTPKGGASRLVRVVDHTQVYPGYDNIVHRWPKVGAIVRQVTYALERTPLRVFGISHVLVIEKVLDSGAKR